MANITVDMLQGLIFYILYCLYLCYMLKKNITCVDTLRYSILRCYSCDVYVF